MNTLKYTAFSILAVLIFTTSCTSDTETKSITTEQLNGQWDLTSALRNGEETSSLEGTFIKFDSGKMTCNFTGEEVTSDFTLIGNELTQGAQKYKIESVTESTLVASTKLSMYDFKLTFTK